MTRLGPRLAVLDDGLFYRSGSEVVSVAATFHRFVEAVAATGAFSEVRYVIPILDRPPGHGTGTEGEGLDQGRLVVVPTEPFSGIADYMARWPLMAARNWGRYNGAFAGVDVVWLRLPASNAPLALAAARRQGVPWFSWIAGSAREVVAGQRRWAVAAQLASLVATGYDAVTELAARTGPHIRLGRDLFASVVSDSEIDATRRARIAMVQSAERGPLRIVWVGRMAAEKGLEDLISAAEILEAAGSDVRLTLVGDGPERPRVHELSERLRQPVAFTGYVRLHAAVMAHLRAADVFVSPSRAEGVPKTVVEAMAAGTPVVATDVGAVGDLIGDNERGWLVPAADPHALAQAIAQAAAAGPDSAQARQALEWAADHTVEAQARRLVRWLEERFPGLDWVTTLR